MIALRSLALVLGTVILASCGRESDRPVTVENPTNSAIVQNEPRILPPTSREDAGSRAYAGTNNTTPRNEPTSGTTNSPAEENYPDDVDRSITRQIRVAIQENDQFSEQARGIEILTFNKRVVLHGTVASQQEKDAISSIVDQAGVTLVDNLLKVQPSEGVTTNGVSRNE